MSKECWRVGVSNHKVNNKCFILDNEFGYNKVPKKTMLYILFENLVYDILWGILEFNLPQQKCIYHINDRHIEI